MEAVVSSCTTTRTAWHAVGLSCKSAFPYPPGSPWRQPVAKACESPPEARRWGQASPPWWARGEGRYIPWSVGKLKLGAAASLAFTQPSTFHKSRFNDWFSGIRVIDMWDSISLSRFHRVLCNSSTFRRMRDPVGPIIVRPASEPLTTGLK